MIREYDIPDGKYCSKDNFDIKSLDKGKVYVEFARIAENGTIKKCAVDLNDEFFSSIAFVKDFVPGKDGKAKDAIQIDCKEGPICL